MLELTTIPLPCSPLLSPIYPHLPHLITLLFLKLSLSCSVAIVTQHYFRPPLSPPPPPAFKEPRDWRRIDSGQHQPASPSSWNDFRSLIISSLSRAGSLLCWFVLAVCWRSHATRARRSVGCRVCRPLRSWSWCTSSKQLSN